MYRCATDLALQPHFAEVDQDELEKDAADDLEAGMRNIAYRSMQLQDLGMTLLLCLYTFMVVVTTEPLNCISDETGVQYVAADPSIKCWEGYV